MHCAHCGSLQVQAQSDTYTCQICGGTTYKDGTAIQTRGLQDERFLNDTEGVRTADQEYAPQGSPAVEPRTIDGVVDLGTNVLGMSVAETKGVPTTPKNVDEIPTSMTTEHSSQNPELEKVPSTADHRPDDENGFVQ